MPSWFLLTWARSPAPSLLPPPSPLPGPARPLTSRGDGRPAREAPPPGSAAPKMADGGAAGPAPVPMATALFRCALCRRSAFSGRRSHLYSAGHQHRLRAVLARLREKAEAARGASASVVPYDPAEHEERFWCACCGLERERHLRHGRLVVPHGGLVQHLASPEHKKAVSTFWWENKADPSLKCQFLISSEDYKRFKASLTKALDAYEASEDEVIQQVSAHIRKVEQSRQEMVQAILEVCVPRMARGTTDGNRAVQGSCWCHNLYKDPK